MIHTKTHKQLLAMYLEQEKRNLALSAEGSAMREALTKIKSSTLTPTKHWIYSIDLAIQALVPVSTDARQIPPLAQEVVSA